MGCGSDYQQAGAPFTKGGDRGSLNMHAQRANGSADSEQGCLSSASVIS